jgi:probable blue pigment (indigoidine) exporter
MSKITYFSFVVMATFLMGSSFAVGKLALEYMPPLFLVAMRFGIAGLIMAPVLLALKKPFPRGSIEWMKVAVIGTLQTAGVMAFIFLGLEYIPSGMSSVITFTNPLLVVFLSAWLLGERLTPIQIGGVVLGIMGVAMAVLGETDWNVGLLIAFGAPVSWALATIFIKKWGAFVPALVMSGLQMGFGSIVLFVLAFLLEDPAQIVWNTQSTLLLLWLGIPASVVQFSLWMYVLSQGEAAKTSSYLFLAPLFGVLTGAVLLGERLGWLQWAGGLFVIASLFVVQRARKKDHLSSSSK